MTGEQQTGGEYDSVEQDPQRIIAEIRNSLARAVERLEAAGARDEALTVFVPSRRVLFFTKSAAMVPAGRVWRLGVFLVDRDGTLYETGSITRAVEQGRSNHQSLSADARREYRAAAFRGPFAPGESVNFDAPVIALDAPSLSSSSGPLFLRGGRAMVRWSPSANDDSAIELDAYLAGRVGLLANPPEGEQDAPVD